MEHPREYYRFIRGVIRIPWWGIWQVIVVFIHGAWKHRSSLWCDDNYDWSHFENKVDRHRLARWKGIKLDPEFGRPHHAHACCDMIMAMNKDKHGKMAASAIRCCIDRLFADSVKTKCE